MEKINVYIYLICCIICVVTSLPSTSNTIELNIKSLINNKTIGTQMENTENEIISCTCAVFLSGQFKKGSTEPPKGLPALIHEQENMFACSPTGIKLCTNKCLDSIVKHLPNSPAILCGSIERDCYKERAYLFIQNCSPKWVNTNLSAGREYCCKDGLPYKCPLI